MILIKKYKKNKKDFSMKMNAKILSNICIIKMIVNIFWKKSQLS